MAKASEPPIVLVEWDDAHMEGWWVDGDPQAPEPDLVRSVGWLVHKTRRHLVLVQSRTDGQQHHSNPSCTGFCAGFFLRRPRSLRSTSFLVSVSSE